jgi:hypothetical protein
VALSLSTLFAVGLDKLPLGNGKTKTKNTQMSKSVDYFKVLNLLLSCFWFLHFALGSTGNRERRGNKRRKATETIQSHSSTGKQSETYRMVSVTRIPPLLPPVHTYKNKDKGKKKEETENSFCFS